MSSMNHSFAPFMTPEGAPGIYNVTSSEEGIRAAAISRAQELTHAALRSANGGVDPVTELPGAQLEQAFLSAEAAQLVQQGGEDI